MVCLSVVCHIRAPCLNRFGFRCRSAGTHLWGPMTHCVRWDPWPSGEGEIWESNPTAKTCNCKLLLPSGEYTGSGSACCQITLVFVCRSTRISRDRQADSPGCCYKTWSSRLSSRAWNTSGTVTGLKGLKGSSRGNTSQSYGASPAIWGHALLPATRHK